MVRQYTNYWCVPAADPDDVEPDRAATSQHGYTAPEVRSTRRSARTTATATSPSGNDIAGLGLGPAALHRRAVPGPVVRLEDDGDATRSSRRSTAPVTRSGSPSTTARTPGSCSATRPSRATRSPRSRRSSGFYVSGPLGPGSPDPWQYRYLIDGRSSARSTASTTSGTRRVDLGRPVRAGHRLSRGPPSADADAAR